MSTQSPKRPPSGHTTCPYPGCTNVMARYARFCYQHGYRDADLVALDELIARGEDRPRARMEAR